MREDILSFDETNYECDTDLSVYTMPTAFIIRYSKSLRSGGFIYKAPSHHNRDYEGSAWNALQLTRQTGFGMGSNVSHLDTIQALWSPNLFYI